MVLMVKCLICNTKLEYRQQDTVALIKHIRDQHPHLTVNLLRMKPISTRDNDKQTAMTKELPDKEVFHVLEVYRQQNDGHDNGACDLGRKILCYKTPVDEIVVNSVPEDGVKVLYKREYRPKKALMSESPSCKKLYKTSIEKWKPGEGKITCPRCAQTRRPIIRMHAEKVSRSPIGAACIMTCWPFCFLPCLFPPPVRENLHCSMCNHFLGVYDYQKEVISPNPDDKMEASG